VRASDEFMHDLKAFAARIVAVLKTSFDLKPVRFFPRRVLSRTGLDDKTMSFRFCGYDLLADLTPVHTPFSQWGIPSRRLNSQKG
jgi:hypothetical protein